MKKSYGNTKLDAAWRYMLAIRNPDKREYAIRYLDELRGVGEAVEPRGLSCMACQEVRMRLHTIWHAGVGQ